jgi:hypothetical protein
MSAIPITADLYLAHNPIFLTITDLSSDTRYIEYFPSSFETPISINPLRLYTYGQTSIRFDISPVVRVAFKDVPHNTNYSTLTPFVVQNNWIKIKFLIKEVLNNGTATFKTPFDKTFVSGGKRTYAANQTVSINKPLIPTEKIPQWGGYPIDYYYFNTSKQMVKSNVVPDELKEIRKIKGCEPSYIKFKNSLGGYSYWLFENTEYEDKSKNYGTINGIDYLKDLGNEVESGITLTSKVPKRFMPLMFDLAISQEIYLFKGNNQWERLSSDNNKVNQNNFNTNEKVKLKFERHHRYNPSLLWSS